MRVLGLVKIVLVRTITRHPDLPCRVPSWGRGSGQGSAAMSEPLVIGSPAACPDLLATSAPPFPARRECRARGDLGCRERAGDWRPPRDRSQNWSRSCERIRAGRGEPVRSRGNGGGTGRRSARSPSPGPQRTVPWTIENVCSIRQSPVGGGEGAWGHPGSGTAAAGCRTLSTACTPPRSPRAHETESGLPSRHPPPPCVRPDRTLRGAEAAAPPVGDGSLLSSRRRVLATARMRPGASLAGGAFGAIPICSPSRPGFP